MTNQKEEKNEVRINLKNEEMTLFLQSLLKQESAESKKRRRYAGALAKRT